MSKHCSLIINTKHYAGWKFVRHWVNGRMRMRGYHSSTFVQSFKFKPQKHRTFTENISHVNKGPTIRTNIHKDKNLITTFYKQGLITNEKDNNKIENIISMPTKIVFLINRFYVWLYFRFHNWEVYNCLLIAS